MSLLGIVLAGGRSSRMGQDKATLVWRGRTLLEHQVALLREAGCDAVLIAGRQDPRWPSLPDEKPFRGPVAGLAHALDKMSSLFAMAPGKLIMVPVDMPLLEASDLLPLIRHPAPLAAFTENPLPCALAVTPDIIRAIATSTIYASPPLKGLWGIIPGATWLTADDPTFLTNINTPEEWKSINKQDGKAHP